MATMTLERASELVSALREACGPTDTKATDLFSYFVDSLGLWGDPIVQFAEMCGFGIVARVTRVEAPEEAQADGPKPTFLPWYELEWPEDRRET